MEVGRAGLKTVWLAGLESTACTKDSVCSLSILSSWSNVLFFFNSSAVSLVIPKSPLLDKMSLVRAYLSLRCRFSVNDPVVLTLLLLASFLEEGASEVRIEASLPWDVDGREFEILRSFFLLDEDGWVAESDE